MDKALGAFLWLKQNLKQPSTMASLAAICAMLGVQLDAGMLQHIINIATLGFGALGFWLQPAKQLAKVD